MTEDKRIYQRLPLESTVFLEVESAAVSGAAPPRILRCHSVDVSERGLSLSLGEALIEGAILQVGIDLADAGFNTIYLAAEVRWSRLEDEQWKAGFTVLHASDSDFSRWHSLLRHMVEAPSP